MDIDVLKKLGLTGNEIKVYLELLKIGLTKAGEVIEETGLSRGQVYDCLDSLVQKSLVSVNIQNKVKYFEAIEPKKLNSFLEERKKELENTGSELKKIIPLLESSMKVKDIDQEILFFKGPSGIKSLFNEYLSEKEILVFGGYSETTKTLQKFLDVFMPNFHVKRIKKKIKMKYLFPRGSMERARQVLKLPLTKVRILPADFSSTIGTQVRGNSADIIVWTENPIAITIKSKDIAKNQKDYFEFLWSISKDL